MREGALAGGCAALWSMDCGGVERVCSRPGGHAGQRRGTWALGWGVQEGSQGRAAGAGAWNDLESLLSQGRR